MVEQLGLVFIDAFANELSDTPTRGHVWFVPKHIWQSYHRCNSNMMSMRANSFQFCILHVSDISFLGSCNSVPRASPIERCPSELGLIIY